MLNNLEKYEYINIKELYKDIYGKMTYLFLYRISKNLYLTIDSGDFQINGNGIFFKFPEELRYLMPKYPIFSVLSDNLCNSLPICLNPTNMSIEIYTSNSNLFKTALYGQISWSI